MAAPAFLKFAPRASLLETRVSRVRVMLLVGAVPWLLGGALVVLLMFPDPGLAFGLITSGVIVLGALASAPIVGANRQWNPTVPKIPVVPAVLVAVLFWLFVFVLRPGVAIPPWS